MKKDGITIKALGEKLKKFRYPLLILLVGMVLMLIPFESGEEEQPVQAPPIQQTVDYKTQTEQQLEKLLEQVEGAGRVTVMLSMKSGAQTIYQVDTTTNSQTTGDGTVINGAQQSTVILSRDDVGEEAAVVKTIYPLFLGAVVVCQGADDPVVELRILRIVESVTGLGSERITIAKMK